MAEAPWRSLGRTLFGIFGVVTLIAVTLSFLGRESLAVDEQSSSAPLGQVELQALASQSTLRIAARSCETVVRGSGFVVDGVLVTNRHVVDGVASVKVDQPIRPAIVDLLAVSPTHDIAILEAPEAIPLQWAPVAASRGDQVTVSGHAGGGPVATESGVVAGRVDGAAYGLTGEVLLLDVITSGGYSGGPVLNDRGAVVAVLQGFDQATGLTLAVPADVAVSELSRSVDAGKFDSAVCGS